MGSLVWTVDRQEGEKSYFSDFDDLECCHVEIGASLQVTKNENKCKQVAKTGGEMRGRGFRGIDW